MSILIYLWACVFSSNAQPGSLDITFNPGTGANGIVRTIVVQPDGRILVAGDFTTFNGTNRNHIARLNTDGSLDNTFDPGDGPSGSSLYSIAVQSDGKVLIGGNIYNVNGLPRSGVARLRDDGSLDITFQPGTGTGISGEIVSSVTVATNGQVLIGGSFTTFNGTNRNGIARLNVDGSLDLTFNPGTGAEGVTSIAVQTNGQVLIGGRFTTVNGTNRNFIARLNSDGSLDNGFNPELIIQQGSPAIASIGVQNDGKVLIGGNFVSINGYTRHNIARLNPDGTLDLSFVPVPGADSGGGGVYSLGVQSNGLAACLT